MKKIFVVFLAGFLTATIPSVFAYTLLFSDVNLHAWYTDAVNNLNEKNIVQGYPDGSFKPENNVTRAELAVMLDRLMEHERMMDDSCDRLNSFAQYWWFEDLNNKYKDQFLKPYDYDDRIDMVYGDYGKGCLTLSEDIFVFMPAQNAHGCHNLYQYDIQNKTLTEAPFTKPYCANSFSSLTKDYVSFIGSESEGGECSVYKGKYFFKKNSVEVTGQSCEEN